MKSVFGKKELWAIMKRLSLSFIAVFICLIMASSGMASSSGAILSKVKAAESKLTDFRAEMVITEANKKNVSHMGNGYGDILRLEKAVVSFKKPDKIRWDGYAEGIKVTYVQNGYVKLVLASMIKDRENVKNSPGKRQDTLDMGFLSSQLWKDNNVTVLSTDKKGVAKMKFDPKSGGNDKRHDLVWVDTKTLKVIKREKYRGSGEMRTRTVFTEFKTLGGKLPIATESTLYDGDGKKLGSVSYKNLKVNVGLENSLFTIK